MPDFSQLTVLRTQKVELERSVQNLRLTVEALRQQLRTQADPTARTATTAKIAQAEATLAATTATLDAQVTSLQNVRSTLLASGVRAVLAPKRPVPAVLFPVRIETCF